MTTETEPPDSSGKVRKDAAFRIKIGNETFEFKTVEFADQKVTGAQVAEAVGAHPVADFVVLQQLKSGEIETLRPTELADLAPSGAERFFVIRGDGTERFLIDGLHMEWPKRTIDGLSLKRLARKDEDDVELVLERSDVPDEVIEDDQEVRIGAHGVEKFRTRRVKLPITIYVDGEDYSVDKLRVTPNEIIRDIVKKDPTTNYLVRLNHCGGRISYKDEGDSPIRLRNGMKFLMISVGPTPVSDPAIRTGVALFIEGLRDLGYNPVALEGHPDHIVIDYEVQSGKFAGKHVRHGFIVPGDFPMTPPTGPHVSPEIHPEKGEGQHPTGAIHKTHSVNFVQKAGGPWQYWSRPFPNWAESKRKVAVYMSHVAKLWETQ